MFGFRFPLGFDMARGQCMFSTCGSMLTTTVRSTFLCTWLDGAVTLSTREANVCPEHERLVEAAKHQPGIELRVSAEGWVWIDNLMYYLFQQTDHWDGPYALGN